MVTRFRRLWLALAALGGLAALELGVAPAALAAPSSSTSSFIGQFHTISLVASTVPSNGDVNPYGVAVVPRSTGALVQGDILVSNFNDSGNLQGTGSTIVEVAPGGQVSQFAHITASKLSGACPGGVGLTTALVALRSGWVIVGSLPTRDGTAATAKAGCLIVLNSHGQVAETFSGDSINGPWDMTVLDGGDHAWLFVTNVLNGTVAASPNVVNRATVLRLNLAIAAGEMPHITSRTVIGSGFAARTDPAALVIGPTGVGLGTNGTLYVADSLSNRIAAIPNAVTRASSAFAGKDVAANGALNDPLGLAIAPNGDILTVNGNDGRLVETTPSGAQVAAKFLDRTGSPPGAGTLFGLAVVPGGRGVYFVDDGSNVLNRLHA